MTTLSESCTPEVIITPSDDVLIETVEVGSVVETSADTVEIVTETVSVEILETDDGETILTTETVTDILTEGMQGPAGPPGLNGSGGLEFPFSWGDASPRTVMVAAAGKLIYGVQIHISEAFDGAGAELTVGDVGQTDRLMTAGQNDPANTGSYTVAPVHVYGTDTTILLTITPGGGATTGAGLLTLFIES